MLRQVEVKNPLTVMGQHDQHEEDLEPDRGDREEIQRDELRQVIIEKGAPRR